MKLYIAGKITGDKEYRKKFAAKEKELKEKGRIILNPAMLPKGLDKGEYMRICFAMIDVADAVVLLPDYRQSAGAMVEYAYSIYVDKPVLDQREDKEPRAEF